MNKSKFIKISLIVILVSFIFLLSYGIIRLREKRIEEQTFSYSQDKPVDFTERKGMWFECDHNHPYWENENFRATQYDLNWYNFTDFELYDWELIISIPEGSYLDGAWNGIYQIIGDKMYISAVNYNEVIKNKVYPFGFILYIPKNADNQDWVPTHYSLKYRRYLAIGDLVDWWVVIVFVSLIVIASGIFITLKIKVKEAKKRQEEYKDIIEQALTTFANAIDAKDPYTEGHSRRVAFYSRELSSRMGFTFDMQEQIYYIAMMHDIGKIGVPDKILNKPSSLTEEEWKIMKQHAVYSGDILKEFTKIPDMSEAVRYHHEWYDGNGYPYKLKGLEIPQISRIISVADSFDTMNSKRVYRGPLPKEEIIKQLRENSGIQFDPEVVPHMISMLEDGTVDRLKFLAS
ncbi:MAG: HD-GYP domain-containing protein [Treponemataceae bacterium]|nr:HD-GYP domain-containing protein [Treponemataceae bacterium]